MARARSGCGGCSERARECSSWPRARSLIGAGAGYAVKPRRRRPSSRTCYRVTKDGTPVRNAHLRLITGRRELQEATSGALTWNQRGAPGPPGRTGRARSSWPARAPRPVRRRSGGLRPRAPHRQPPCPGFQTSGRLRAAPALQRRRLRARRHARRRRPPSTAAPPPRAIACAVNDDFFAVAAARRGGERVADVREHGGARDALLDSSGNVLASAAGSSPQSVGTAGAVAGTVYVRVRAVGNAQGAYTLSL